MSTIDNTPQIDVGLIYELRKNAGLDVFVETGTFKGDTLALVEGIFSEIYSVELSRELFEAARRRFVASTHINLVSGDTTNALNTWQPILLERSVLYFIKPHRCFDGNSTSLSSPCSILDELRVIDKLNERSVLIINDVCLFFTPSQAPHAITQWPTLPELLAALRRLAPDHCLVVFNDMFILFPAHLQDVMLRYTRSVAPDVMTLMGKMSDHNKLFCNFDILMRQFAEMEQTLGEVNLARNQSNTLMRSLLNAKEKSSFSHAEIDDGTQDIDLRLLKEVRNQVYELHQLAEKIRLNGENQLLQSLLLHQLIEYRDRCIMQQKEIEKLQSRLLKQQLRTFIGRYLAPHRYPKLGRLWHHDPLPIQVWGMPPLANYAMWQSWPRISLVTPSFGQVEFIGRTIDSVLDQLYPNLQYFVQDGGSDDGTAEILQSYDGRLSGWILEKDSGQSQGINRGFVKTDGEIMAWLNSDDLMMPGTLAYVADYFMRHPNVDVVYGNRILIDEHDMEIGRWILPKHSDGALLWADFIPQETLFWRRSIWEKAGGFIDESFRFAMDWDLLLRFRRAGARMTRLPRFLGAFRVHDAQKTSMTINEVGQAEMDRLRIRELGRSVMHPEIHRALAPYMFAHVCHDLWYRVLKRLSFF